MTSVQIGPPASQKDRQWLYHLWENEWGGHTMIARGIVYQINAVDALLARDRTQHLGAVTWAVSEAGEAELISLNSVVENQGIGTALLEAAEAAAREAGASRMVLITSNDNIHALAFYQKRGYRLEALYPGAIDAARKTKPSIPIVGQNGIPIHDEILLGKQL